MRDSATIISICLMPFLLYGGCSREEPPPVQESKVVRPIKRPEKATPLLTDRDERAEDEAMEAQETRTAAREKEKLKPLLVSQSVVPDCEQLCPCEA